MNVAPSPQSGCIGQEAALEAFDRRATGRRHHLHRGNKFSVPVKQRNGDRAHALFEFLIAQTQAEIELQTKLQNEVEAERLSRLDKMLLSEQQEQGVTYEPGEGATFLVRENRNLMIGRRFTWPKRSLLRPCGVE